MIYLKGVGATLCKLVDRERHIFRDDIVVQWGSKTSIRYSIAGIQWDITVPICFIYGVYWMSSNKGEE
jgi:hypothetical protein